MVAASFINNESYYDLLRDAIFDNDAERFQELMTRQPVEIDRHDAVRLWSETLITEHDSHELEWSREQGGQTLLHLACFWGRMPIVKLLLSAGANMKAKNAAGCTALDLATHWGHSAVAEVLRMRGGPSVWEEKMGRLQIEVEDLRQQLNQCQEQYLNKKQQHHDLVDELHRLHTLYEEEKSAHLLCQHALDKAVTERSTLRSQVHHLEGSLAIMTEKHQEALIDKTRADHLRMQADQETSAAIEHRDEILAAMKESVRKQDELTNMWQRAEVAAAIADSQRNYAFVERDRCQKAHVAALGDVVILEARLGDKENELMELRNDLAEHIYEAKRAQRLHRRAERAMATLHGNSADIHTGRSQAMTPKATARSNMDGQTGRVMTPGTPTSTARNRVDSAGNRQNLESATKKKHFSLAAREFGEHMRSDERRKLRERTKRKALVEQQYLTQCVHHELVESDTFQQDFVHTLQDFAATRKDQWQVLKKDRDRQMAFAERQLMRPVATAPTPFRGSGLDGLLLPQVHHRGSISQGDSRRPSISSSHASRMSTGGGLNFGVYRKYVGLGDDGHAVVRPVASPIETRKQIAFFAQPAVTESAKQPEPSAVRS